MNNEMNLEESFPKCNRGSLGHILIIYFMNFFLLKIEKIIKKKLIIFFLF